jgi:hypothetical protein
VVIDAAKGFDRFNLLFILFNIILLQYREIGFFPELKAFLKELLWVETGNS